MKINIKSLNPKQSLQLFLICSVAYYHKYESLISDEQYDYLSKYLLEHFEDWQDHEHSWLVSKENLTAGTMYNIKYTDYPTIIRVATDMHLREYFYETEVDV